MLGRDIHRSVPLQNPTKQHGVTRLENGETEAMIPFFVPPFLPVHSKAYFALFRCLLKRQIFT